MAKKVNPLPSDEKLVEILDAVLKKHATQLDAEIQKAPKPVPDVCLISFGHGDKDICMPQIHDQTNCDLAALKINQESGRTDAVGNILKGPCAPTSRKITSPN